MRQLKMTWFIALKDLKLFFLDRTAFIMFIIFPFLFVTLFSLMSFDSKDTRLELHITTREDKGGLSRQIVKGMETKNASKLKPGQPKIIWDKDYNKTLQRVKRHKLDGFLAFPADFTEGAMLGYDAKLEVITDAEATDTRAALQGLAQGIASRVGSQQVANNATIGLLIEPQIEQVATAPKKMEDIGAAIQKIFSKQQGPSKQKSFITFRTKKVGERKATNPSNWVIPGYLVMFVFFAAAISAEMIVRERQNHTLERLIASSVRQESILGGIFLGTTFKGLVQIAIFWMVGIFVFKADLGIAPAAVILLSVLTVVMSSAFGVMLATLAKTQRSAGSAAVLTSLTFAPLGGCWWPLFVTPKWMQNLAKISPHGWATTGFNKLMLFGGNFSSVTNEMLALVGFAVIFGVIAIWRFRVSATESS